MSDHEFIYEKEEHAAASTGDYVFNQLIPYIGNKRKLLDLLQRAVRQTSTPGGATFFDVFAGSGVVSRMAKKSGFRVIANDWEPYALEINRCWVACNSPPPFEALGGYAQAIQTLNSLPPREDWVARHLCPSDDERYDVQRDRLFFTRSNGMRIDAMRVQIAEWQERGLIDERERACLLGPMLYQTCYTSNTSGVFKGFHNGWGGQTRTALYRILSTFELKPAVLYDNGLENAVHQRDSLDLARELARSNTAVDIAYLDPPYNQHPYGSNYHVLNTVALWDKPALSEKIEGRNKAAIREDWRTQRRSAYNYRGEAVQAYAELVQTLSAKHILTSYSTDGTMPLRSVIDICTERGATQVLWRSYKRYRVSSQRFSHKPLTVEFVLVVDTGRRHTGRSAEELCEQIRAVEREAIDNHQNMFV
jgi:adenine-specific DNA-methyltransferase